MKEENMNDKIAMIPFGAYEMLQDRNDAEKDKMRKHYRKLVMWICIAFATFIIAVFGSFIFFLHNFEFSTYSQDVQTGVANYIGNDGDIINGEADNQDSQTEIPSSNRDSSK